MPGQERKKSIAAICFTAAGCETILRIRHALGQVRCWCKKKEIALPPGVLSVDETLGEWTGARFADSDLLVFVGATGIAVRAIAPHLVSKKTDPAVLCVDEAGTYVISLVSGHIGGANREAAELAHALGAMPVITTATDINGKFAVDVFARENALAISDMKLAKYISAAILDGEQIRLVCAGRIEGEVPPELARVSSSETEDPAREAREIERAQDTQDAQDVRQTPGIRIDWRAAPVGEGSPAPKGRWLYLIPSAVSIGLGCRRGKEPAELVALVRRVLARERIFPEAVETVATIDIKKDEAAMQAVAGDLGVPLLTFGADALRACPGSFSASAFVRENVGVDNVCERSAVLAAGLMARGQGPEPRANEDGTPPVGELIVKKEAGHGMTIAIAVREWRVCFA